MPGLVVLVALEHMRKQKLERGRQTETAIDRDRDRDRESERLHVAALAAQRVAARRVARRDATHYASQGDACQALQRNALDFGAGA